MMDVAEEEKRGERRREERGEEKRGEEKRGGVRGVLVVGISPWDVVGCGVGPTALPGQTRTFSG